MGEDAIISFKLFIVRASSIADRRRGNAIPKCSSIICLFLAAFEMSVGRSLLTVSTLNLKVYMRKNKKNVNDN